MGIGILADSEEIAAEYVTKLTELFGVMAEELVKLSKYEGHIQIIPPKEDSEEPTGSPS